MSTAQIVELTEEHIRPFLQGEVVARIIHETAGWFVGTRRSIKLEGEKCLLRLDPLKQWYVANTVDSPDPKDPGQVFLPSTAEAKGNLRLNELAFRLVNPRRLVNGTCDNDILIIVANGETAIISRRPEDIQAVKKILGSEAE